MLTNTVSLVYNTCSDRYYIRHNRHHNLCSWDRYKFCSGTIYHHGLYNQHCTSSWNNLLWYSGSWKLCCRECHYLPSTTSFKPCCMPFVMSRQLGMSRSLVDSYKLQPTIATSYRCFWRYRFQRRPDLVRQRLSYCIRSFRCRMG